MAYTVDEKAMGIAIMRRFGGMTTEAIREIEAALGRKPSKSTLSAWVNEPVVEGLTHKQIIQAEKPDLSPRLINSIIEKLDDSGIVYFVRRSDGLIKIGKTKTFESRRSNIQTHVGQVQVLILISCKRMSALERDFHKLFAHKNVFGEWFKLTEIDLAFIASNFSDSIIEANL